MPPYFCDHCVAPADENEATNASRSPLDFCCAVPPNFAVPLKPPATSTLPAAPNATAVAQSSSLPPMVRAHFRLPLESSTATNPSMFELLSPNRPGVLELGLE